MSDLSTLIVDLLRQKADSEAVHAGEGPQSRFGAQMTPAEAAALLKAQSTPMKPNPAMLGTGALRGAAEEIEPENRRAAIAAQLAQMGE